MRADQIAGTERADDQRASAGANAAADSRVNALLTAKRRHEAADLGRAVDRMMRGLVRRAEAGDMQALVELVKLERALIGHQREAARGLNREHGYSWLEVGMAVGVSRQGVWQRWGR